MRDLHAVTPAEEEALKLSHQLCFPLYAAARRVVGLYTPYLAPLGLTYTQYIVLLALWEEDGLTVGELGSRLFLDSGTLTPVFKKLEGSGYLLRERDSRDERSVRVRLTPQGASFRSQVKDIPAQVGSCLPLSPTEAGQLYLLLYQVLRQA